MITESKGNRERDGDKEKGRNGDRGRENMQDTAQK